MADEHLFPGGSSFPSGLGAAPFYYNSASYALPPPPGLDAAAMQGFGMAWVDLQQLPDSSSAAATTTAHFDSALSSLVSSPAHNAGDCYAAGADDVAAIGDLIGRLGSICNGATAASANNSCYSTPLSSPPRGGAAASPAALAFRPGGGYPGCVASAAALEMAAGTPGRLSRVASSKSVGAGAATPGMACPEAETSTKAGGAGAETRDPAPPAKGGGARKRKASGKGKTTSSAAKTAAAAAGNASPKRTKVTAGGGAGEGKEDEDGEATAAAAEAEPAKDYIHVRARRGQATDSHSLAERVRRERISERMKMLQSLVPGCNKITGKALMLDEIINYVQSLQRQVEFLSMKLATMNPADLDADDARYQAAAAAPHHSPPAAAAFSSYASAVDTPPFVAAHQLAHQQLLDSGWEAQDLQSVVARHSHVIPDAAAAVFAAGVHVHDMYASPAPPPPAHSSSFHGQQLQQGSHMKPEEP
ncbi:unnamed protein product [Urochloa decumbens]|uniref:BHLH domain-containing protein n=1 Tax=Urochloa decumbens TaxID=240449 RepID=A0ABC9DAF8_9POAL